MITRAMEGDYEAMEGNYKSMGSGKSNIYRGFAKRLI